ncbi:MAG TPA: choice-of-anchor D domain-containing protein [Actinomycetota bacterium]|nr:choice-of-anchor D domain-containing protein [Actinomycetota bacterium]
MRRTLRLLVIGSLVCVPAVVAIASADMSASPSSVTFPQQCTHTSTATKPIIVTNNGPDDVTDVTVSVLPTAMASVFQLGGQTGASQLPSGSQMQMQVGFLPEHVGANGATAVVTFTDPGVTPTPTETHHGGPPSSPTPSTGTLEIPLSGSALDRWIDVNPPGLNFGFLHTGKTAPNQTITIFDDGDSPMTITNVFLGGRQPGDFTMGRLSSNMVSDGNPVTMTLGFKPKAAGARAAMLFINSNSCSGTFIVQLGGIAVEQDITASPKSLDFANVQVGATPAPSQQVAIVNQGGAPLTVKSIQMLADDPTTTDASFFKLTGVPKVLPKVLKPGEPINLNITFNPADATPRKVNIKVTSNDPDTPIMTIPVTALAVAKPTPTPSVTAAAPPPTKPTGGGFHLHLGAYVPVVIVAAIVAAFFWALIFTRRRRGIPE